MTAVVRSRQPTNEARAEMSLLNLCLARKRKTKPTAYIQEWEEDSHPGWHGTTKMIREDKLQDDITMP